MTKYESDGVIYNIREADQYDNKMWYEMQVLGSFVNFLHRGSKTYIQFLQADGRPAMNGFEIKIPSVEDLYKHIDMAREYEKERKTNAKKIADDIQYFYREEGNKFLNKSNSEIVEYILKSSISKFNFFNNEYQDYEKDNEYEMYNDAIKSLEKIMSIDKEKDISLSYKNFLEQIKSYNKDKTEYNKINDKDINRAYMYFINNVLNYVEGFHIDNLVFGDFFSVKDNNSVLKRYNGVASPANMLITGKEFAPEKNQYVVFFDPLSKMSVINDIKGLYSKIYGDEIETTDGMTFIDPKFIKEHIEPGSGIYGLMGSLKNHIRYMDEKGYMKEVKTCSFVITDAIADISPVLNDIRNDMRKNDIQQYIALSSFKQGAPSDKNILEFGQKIEKKHIHSMLNKYYGIQYNPEQHSKQIINITQNMFHANTNGKSPEESKNIFDAHAQIISLQTKLFELQEKVFTTNVQGKEEVSLDNMREFLIKNLSVTDNELKDILDNGIPLEYPAIYKHIITKISSLYYKKINQVKFPGAKYPLMSDSGIDVYRIKDKSTLYTDIQDSDIKKKILLFEEELAKTGLPKEILYKIRDAVIRTNSNRLELDGEKYIIDNQTRFTWVEALNEIKEEYREKAKKTYNDLIERVIKDEVIAPKKLGFRDEKGFSEAIIPRDLADRMGIKVGDVLMMTPAIKEKYQQAIATRIPATGKHSTLLLKVIAIDEKTERIITSENIIHIHGSDFDADSLFIMHREVFDDDSIINKKKYKKGQLIGYDNKGNWDYDFAKKVMSFPDTQDAIRLKIQLQKNIIFDNYIKVYSKKENIEDMNSPINFKPLESKAFENYNKDTWLKLKAKKKSFPSYIEDIFNDITKDNEFLKKELKTIYKDGKFNPKVFDFKTMETSLMKGKLLFSEEIKKELFDSSIGLDTILKVLIEKEDLKFNYDLGLTYDRYIAYMNSINRSQGINIIASQMRNIAYLLQTQKDLQWKIKHPISVDGHIYDSLGDIKDNGNRAFEDADTLINGFLDDIKKQVMWMLNATESTTNVIGYMNFLKMPVNMIALFLNQPVLKDIGLHNINLFNHIKISKKFLIQQYEMKSKESFSPGDEDIFSYTYKELANSLLNNNDKSLKDIRSPEDIKLQIKILLLFESLYRDAKSMIEINDFVSLITKFPNNIFEIKDVYDKIRRIEEIQKEEAKKEKKKEEEMEKEKEMVTEHETETEEKVIPEIVNEIESERKNEINILSEIFNFPHINAACKTIKRLYEHLSETMKVYDPRLLNIVTDISRNMIFKDRNTDMKEYIHNEFISFLTSSIISDLVKKGEIILPLDKVAVWRDSENNGRFITKDMLDEIERTSGHRVDKKQITYVSPEQVLVENYIQHIAKAKRDVNNRNNKFLSYITITPTYLGLSKLSFNAGLNVKPEIRARIKVDFLHLDSSLKKDIMLYNLIKDKFNYGLTKMSGFFNSEKTVNKYDSIYYFAEEYKKKLDTLVDNNKLDNIKDYFELQFIKKNYNILNSSNIKRNMRVTTQIKNRLLKSYFDLTDEEMLENYIIIKDVSPTYIYDNMSIYSKYGEDVITEIEKGHSIKYYIYKRIDYINRDNMYHYDDKYENEEYKAEDVNKILASRIYDSIKSFTGQDAYIRDAYKTITGYIPRNQIKDKRIIITDSRTKDRVSVNFSRKVESQKVKDIEQHYIDPVDKKDKVRKIPLYENTITESYNEVLPISDESYKAEYNKMTLTGKHLSKDQLIQVLDIIKERNDMSYEIDPVKFEKVAQENGFEPKNYPAGIRGKDGVLYMNTTGLGHSYGADTPIHEAAHTYIDKIEKDDPGLYQRLMEDIYTTDEGKDILNKIRDMYSEYSGKDQMKEAIVSYIGVLGAKRIKTEAETTLWERIKHFIKKLFGFTEKYPDTFGEVLDILIGKEIRVDGYSKGTGNVLVEDYYGREEKVSLRDYNFVKEYTLSKELLDKIIRRYADCIPVG